MPQVVDKATGTLAEVAGPEATKGFVDGRYELVAGQRYQLRLADGSYGHADAAHVGGAVEAGATLTTPDEARAAELAQRQGGKAGGGLALSTATLAGFTGGLSDMALTGAAEALESSGARPKGYAQAFREELGGARELHPVQTMVGEGLGATALGAVLPGGGAGGVAEGAGGAGLRALGVTGETAAGRIAARAFVQGLRGVAEGAQMGVQQAISDAAIHDHELTAQQVLSYVKPSALWGGALGAGLGGAGAALAEVPVGKLATEGKNALTKALGKAGSDADVEAVAGRVVGAPPAEGLGIKLRKWYTKVSAAATGAKAEDIEPFVGGEFEPGSAAYENRRALLEADHVRDAASREVRSHVDEMLQASRAITDEARGPMKRGYIRAAMDGVEPLEAARAARDAIDHTMTELGDMIANAEDYGGAAPLKRAFTVARQISDRAKVAGDAAEQFALVDDLKRAIGKYTKGASRLNPAAATDELIALQNRARAARLQGLYETLRTGLEDESVWKRAAVDQKAINASWSTQIEASDRFHRALTTEIGRDPENPWQTIRGVDPAKSDAYVKGLLDPSKDLTHKAVTDYVSSTKALSQTIRDAYELPPEKMAEVAKVARSADAFQKAIDKTAKTLTLTNQFEHLREVASGHSTAFAMAAGAAAHGISGGVAGLALGKVAGLFTRPADTILQLATIEKMARESEGRIARALRGFARKAAAPREAPELATYARKAAQVERLVGSPDTLAERVGSSTAPLRDRAPKLASALTGSTIAGLALLRDKMPPKMPADPFRPRAMPAPPPAAQRERWLRYYDAVQDPIGVVEDLRASRLNPEGIEVLRTVYPRLYDRVRAHAIDQMAAGRLTDLDRQQRIGLATLLDLPTPERDPRYIASCQAAFASLATPPPEGPKSQAPARPINLAKREPVLPAERVEQGQSQQG